MQLSKTILQNTLTTRVHNHMCRTQKKREINLILMKHICKCAEQKNNKHFVMIPRREQNTLTLDKSCTQLLYKGHLAKHYKTKNEQKMQ